MKRILLMGITIILVIGLYAQQKGTFEDPRTGKTYETVEIGNQVWMAENLVYKPDFGKYWTYNNDVANMFEYGYLYDWQTACNVCPTGWHLPSDDEWTQLTDFVDSNEGTNLKANSGWLGNGNGTDDYGFSALPGGIRAANGQFKDIDYRAYWWSSTDGGFYEAWRRDIYCSYSTVSKTSYDKHAGLSVRCLMD